MSSPSSSSALEPAPPLLQELKVLLKYCPQPRTIGCQSREPEEVKVSTERLEVRIGGRREENVSLDDGRSLQAAWIRQDMEHQEEEDDANSNDSATWEEQSFEVVEAKSNRRKSKGELSSPSRVLDAEDSRRSGFVDMLLLLNIYADTIPWSEIEDYSAGGISVDSGKY
ncbi:unnamed protein product [Miscanthus lutarioriparius]|uniref:Uncharacterized protein n=1 Tax=Miscanthus lutarioriparius TaxID=422564 RepID=A0A811SA52_9POAL|nr:unnamed protein product [Miscanthus lutarioriparius]